MNEEEYEIHDGIKRRIEMSESYDRPTNAIDRVEWGIMKDKIEDSFHEVGRNPNDERFLDTIWQVSTVDLPGLEVSVVVDGKNQLYIGKGTGSFVDYTSENVIGMIIPMKCWIHTHPFGAAYFSSTDWYTINTQRPILNSAIVLGKMERMKWYKDAGNELLCRTETITLDEEE